MLRRLAIALLAAGLGAGAVRAEDAARPVVIATLFPVADFAREIAGDAAEIVPLLPPGAEAHSYAPTPADMVRLSSARLFLYVSPDMETWVPGLVANAPATLRVRAVAPESEADAGHEAEEHEPGDDGGHDHHGHDPHVWLDPLQALDMADRIAAALAEADPAQAGLYQANAAGLKSRLTDLHNDILAGLADCRSRVVVCGGHFAFGHFAERYGLRHLSPYAGFSPNAQPSPRALAELVRTLRTLGTSAIFYEEILDPKLARVLADETGAQLLPLHSMHNMTREDIAAGATYFTLMRRNLENLRKGLGCAP